MHNLLSEDESEGIRKSNALTSQKTSKKKETGEIQFDGVGSVYKDSMGGTLVSGGFRLSLQPELQPKKQQLNKFMHD